MRKIKVHSLPHALGRDIRTPDSLEGEDILIEDDDGTLLAAIIQPKAYRFLLRMIEEREDRVDERAIGEYDPDGKTLDDLIEETDSLKNVAHLGSGADRRHALPVQATPPALDAVSTLRTTRFP